MEHNQNGFARPAPRDEGHGTADRPAPPPGPPAAADAPPPPDPPGSRLDFEPIALARRSGGWSPGRQRDFIEALADCGIVREAAARVGMSEQSARRLRSRPDAAGFNAAWAAALQFGAEHLRSVAYERAVEGAIKSYFYHGRKVGEDRVYDNRLLLSLIARAESPVSKADVRRVLDDWDGWMAAIEHGAPPPEPAHEDEAPRVWPDVEGRWWTDFPPPPGFAGDHRGDYGDEDYCRVCTAAELARIEAMQARQLADEHRHRDAFFARLR
jgi:hypothetical protein